MGQRLNKKSKHLFIIYLDYKASDPQLVAFVSPVTYIKKTSPPVFIVHSSADPIVPLNQSVQLQKRFAKVGVYNEFISVDGGGHGTFEKEKKTEIALAVLKFLKQIGVI